jgi:hypothetical protein
VAGCSHTTTLIGVLVLRVYEPLAMAVQMVMSWVCKASMARQHFMPVVTWCMLLAGCIRWCVMPLSYSECTQWVVPGASGQIDYPKPFRVLATVCQQHHLALLLPRGGGGGAPPSGRVLPGAEAPSGRPDTWVAPLQGNSR